MRLLLMYQRWDIAAGAAVVVALPLAVAVTPPMYVAVDAQLFLARLDDKRGCFAGRC